MANYGLSPVQTSISVSTTDASFCPAQTTCTPPTPATSSFTIAPGSSAQYTIQFGPEDTNFHQASFSIGPVQYALSGWGTAPIADDQLVVTYVDANQVQLEASTVAPISFGQPTVGSSSTLTFTIANPQSYANPVSLPSIFPSPVQHSLLKVCRICPRQLRQVTPSSFRSCSRPYKPRLQPEHSFWEATVNSR